MTRRLGNQCTFCGSRHHVRAQCPLARAADKLRVPVPQRKPA